MSAIEDYWSEGSTIFLNKSVLTPTHIPDEIFHREKELGEIAEALRPLAVRGEKPENVLVHGTSGLGKTISVRYILEKLKERCDAMPIYANCWGMDSLHQLMLELLPHFLKNVPARGVSTTELFSKLGKNMSRMGKRAVIVLDEFDRFLTAEERAEVLYEFTRMEIDNSPGLIVVGSPKLRNVEDTRVKSSLMGVEVEYAPYTEEQLKSIFAERIVQAFRKGKVKEGVLGAVVEFSHARSSDVRAGLACLRIAGEIADYEERALDAEDIERAKEKVIDGDIYSSLSLLTPSLAELLYITALKGSITSGELYSEYCTRVKEPMSDRSYRRNIEKLEKMGLVNAKESGKGMQGRTRIISLNVDPKEVKEAYVKLVG
jgi:cell division control protein 6